MHQRQLQARLYVSKTRAAAFGCEVSLQNSSKIILATLCLCLAIPPAEAAAKTTKHKVSAKSGKAAKSVKKVKHSRRSARKRGQQAIDSARTREIQQALISKGYLKGEPSGEMDAQTKAALAKLQEEHGWQTRIVPDARALIVLGLGPKQDGLLNPDTAAIANSSDLSAQAVGAKSQK